MTETMIDLPEAIAKSDDADFLRELSQDAAQRLMDIKVAAACGAGHGERNPDRENQRNGYRPRQWDTRAGTIGLNSKPPPRAVWLLGCEIVYRVSLWTHTK
ncbi:hypothetical protein DC366_19450, partial [Pelagivirga sediminicola]